jgi:hypothetical protein
LSSNFRPVCKNKIDANRPVAVLQHIVSIESVAEFD